MRFGASLVASLVVMDLLAFSQIERLERSPRRSGSLPAANRRSVSAFAPLALAPPSTAGDAEEDDDGASEDSDVLDGVGRREISPEVTAGAAGVEPPEER